MNFYGRELNAYKANLHTHTTVSDGLFLPSQIVDIYERGGYDCLCLTDHRKTNDITALKSDKMTLLSGIELHPMGPRGINWHLLAINVPYDFPGIFETAQEAIDAVNAAGGMVFVAHPYWCGLTSAEVMSLRDTVGMEVYNTSTRYIGKEFNMTIWDEILDHGCLFNALAVDDVHLPHDFFRGWTMICAKDRSPESLIKALRNGEFYSSMGPEIHTLEYKDGIFHAEFSTVTSAILMSNKSYGNCGTVPDPEFWRQGFVEKNELTCNAREWFPAGSYIRLQLCTADGRYAWSNPILV